MKPLYLLLALCLYSLSTSAQGRHYPLPVDTVEHRTVMEGVVPVSGASQAELYSRARAWVSHYFVSGKTVLDLDDATNGKLIAKGHSTYTPLHSLAPNVGRLWRTIQIDVKEGRYRYQITDFYFGLASAPATVATAFTPLDRLMFGSSQYDKAGSPRRILANVAGGVEAAAKEDIDSLAKAMSNSSAKNKEW